MPLWLIILGVGGVGYAAYKYLVKPAPATKTVAGTHAAAAPVVMKQAPAAAPSPVAAVVAAMDKMIDPGAQTSISAGDPMASSTGDASAGDASDPAADPSAGS